ncbi:MAG: ATPase [Lachnospiraceae bacterium]|nr:ATPase [Lachnospiraceae bacterium]
MWSKKREFFTFSCLPFLILFAKFLFTLFTFLSLYALIILQIFTHNQKGGIHTNYNQMLNEKKRLEHKLKTIQKELSALPEGKLICARNGKCIKWYHSDGKIRTLIKKKDRAYAERLAVKKYLTTLSEELICEIRAIDFYLRHHHSSNESLLLLTEKPGYPELLSPYFHTFSEEQAAWVMADYDRNTKYPQHLRHKASSGRMVRSKSEALIDYILTTNKIPFRYECCLELNGTTLYPDFTILHPRTNKIIYWEHFGMMDDDFYSKNVGSKLQLYISNGIIPSIDLIITFETSSQPLDIRTVERIVKEYFLD